MTQAFTFASLGHKSTNELRCLFAQAHRALAVSDAGSHERQVALANIDTVSKALAVRMILSP